MGLKRNQVSDRLICIAKKISQIGVYSLRCFRNLTCNFGICITVFPKEIQGADIVARTQIAGVLFAIGKSSKLMVVLISLQPAAAIKGKPAGIPRTYTGNSDQAAVCFMLRHLLD